MGILDDVAVFREGTESGYEALGLFDREAQGLEEPRLAAIVRMSGVQQVVNDFLSLDYSETGMAEPHVVSSFSHGNGRITAEPQG